MDDKFLEEKAIRLARENFWKGFHCSEAIMIAMGDYLGVTSGLIPMIATGFGGGIASSGLICGALVGGVMVIGIEYGRSEVTDIKADRKTKDLTQRFIQQFKKITGSTSCYDITQCDFNTLEGKRKFVESGRRKQCQALAAKTVSILINLMKDIESK